MNAFKKIVVAIDVTSAEHRALEEVRAIATGDERSPVGIVLVHVVEPAPWYSRFMPRAQEIESAQKTGAEQVLAELAAGLADARRTVTTRVVVGKPAIEVVREVIRAGADLLAVDAASGDRTALSPMAFQVVRTAPCPVWIVRERRAPKGSGTRAVLAPVDPAAAEDEEDPLNLKVRSEPGREQLDDAILEMAAAFAREWRTNLHVLHAWSVPGEDLLRGEVMLSAQQVEEYVHAAEQAHRTALNGLLARNPGITPHPSVHLIKGSPTSAILDEAATLRPDLIVMGTVVRTGLPGFLMGNTAETVIRHAACSLVALKPKGFVSPVSVE
jgi:nucleotide-binding universal stress UspA family protein